MCLGRTQVYQYRTITPGALTVCLRLLRQAASELIKVTSHVGVSSRHDITVRLLSTSDWVLRGSLCLLL